MSFEDSCFIVCNNNEVCSKLLTSTSVFSTIIQNEIAQPFSLSGLCLKNGSDLT